MGISYRYGFFDVVVVVVDVDVVVVVVAVVVVVDQWMFVYDDIVVAIEIYFRLILTWPW